MVETIMKMNRQRLLLVVMVLLVKKILRLVMKDKLILLSKLYNRTTCYDVIKLPSELYKK
jgi:hypothetical protein